MGAVLLTLSIREATFLTNVFLDAVALCAKYPQQLAAYHPMFEEALGRATDGGPIVLSESARAWLAEEIEQHGAGKHDKEASASVLSQLVERYV